MGLTIRKVRDEGKTAENFYSHMTAIQNLSVFAQTHEPVACATFAITCRAE